METRYDRATHSFLILDGNGNELGDSIKYRFLDNHKGNNFEEENLDDFSFTVCFKERLKESEDFSLIENKDTNDQNKRIGWVIPLSLLISEDDNIMNDPHLSCYVFHAYQYLLKSDDYAEVYDDQSFNEKINEESNIYKCLLITNNHHLANTDIKRLELPLARYGYYFHDNHHYNEKRKKVEKNKIKLSLAFNVIDNTGSYIDPYFDQLLEKHLTVQEPIIRFLYLYQVIEVLMNKVLIKNLEDLIAELKGPTGSIREVSDVLKKQTEIERWKKIETGSAISPNDYEELGSLCNRFVNRTQDPFKHPNSIYKVRNHITHRFRIAAQNQNDINDINNLFEMYLYDLLIKYKEV